MYSANIENKTTKRYISPIAKQRLEAQGFIGFEDRYLAEVNYWLRLSPAICMLWVGIGTCLASPLFLWALIPFAFLGAVLRGHPFDALYNYGIRLLTGTPPLPEYGKPRRFGCAIMTVWLALTGWVFYSGATIAGYALGSIAVILPLINVTTGFCVPSFTYGLLFGKPQSRAVEKNNL